MSERYDVPCGVVPFSAPVVERGMGFFETLLVVGGRALLWEEHIARLLGTLARWGLPSPTTEALTGAAARALEPLKNAGDERALRISWIALESDLDAERSWRLDVSTREVPEATRARRRGASVVTLPSDLARDTARMKSTSYVSALLGQREARRRGADEAIFTTADGVCLEGTSTGLVLWNDGKPVLAAGPALPSITASALAGADAPRRELREKDLLEGAMLAGALTLAAPIVSLDGKPCAQPEAMRARVAEFNARLLALR
jgi:4-amino-4-deoxychorismate lyase